MTTENAQAPDVEPGTDVVVSPLTGTIVALDAPATDLLGALDELKDLLNRAGDYRRALEGELVRRIDARGKRKAEVDGCILETNPPTEDLYEADAVRRELEPLVEAGVVDRELLDELIVTPPPAPAPAPRVDKRVVNTLKSSDNRELLAALARARNRVTKSRTLKVLGRPVEGTAEEVGDDQ